MNRQMECFNGVMRNGLIPYKTALEQAVPKIDDLLFTLRDVLDRPTSTSKPDYACGQTLEDIKEVVEYTIRQISHINSLILAYAGAFGEYPEDDDDADMSRRAFVKGFMANEYEKNM